MKTIVCFGDSNTFGVNPEGGRYPRRLRWTGQLQELLGNGYYIVEEGLNGRTTVWEDPMQPWRNGAKALPYVLQTHKPMDLLLIMLGTNDCKTYLNVSAEDIARGLDSLCRKILHFDYHGYPVPGIFLVSPIYIGEQVTREGAPFDTTAVAKSKMLAAYYRRVADAYHAGFFDASQVASHGSDSLHMDAGSHTALARALTRELQHWFARKRDETEG